MTKRLRLRVATQKLQPYAAAHRPLPKKMAIHGYACGGAHLAYSVLVAARHGFLQRS